MEDLKEKLVSALQFPPEKAEELAAISKKSVLEPGGYFVREGQVPRKFGILFSGIMRYYYVDNDGNEYTKGLILENQVLSAYTAMVHGQPSALYIQALENAVILETDYDRWLSIRENDRFWDKFLISVLQKGYITKEKRERDLLLLDAESRYRLFREEFGPYEHRLKQHIIASYLGIKPESLSRIRKKDRT